MALPGPWPTIANNISIYIYMPPPPPAIRFFDGFALQKGRCLVAIWTGTMAVLIWQATACNAQRAKSSNVSFRGKTKKRVPLRWKLGSYLNGSKMYPLGSHRYWKDAPRSQGADLPRARISPKP